MGARLWLMGWCVRTATRSGIGFRASNGRSIHLSSRATHLDRGAASGTIVTTRLQESALYGGAISGRGPRYCPSIEDKIVKFPDAVRHQIFPRAGGPGHSEIYVNAYRLRFLQTSSSACCGRSPARTSGNDSAGLRDRVRLLPTDATPPDASKPERLRDCSWLARSTGHWLRGSSRPRRRRRLSMPLPERGRLRDRHSARPSVHRLTSGRPGDAGVDEPYRLFTSRAEIRLVLRQINALTQADRLGGAAGAAES
jgi:tRNA uridine 5-carboxymethylaminomethyl modification enzyme